MRADQTGGFINPQGPSSLKAYDVLLYFKCWAMFKSPAVKRPLQMRGSPQTPISGSSPSWIPDSYTSPCSPTPRVPHNYEGAARDA